MEALKQQYLYTALKNVWKAKEFQVLNNLRSLRQITQFEYEERLNSHPELYTIELRNITPNDNPALILEIADSIEKGLSADSISQMFGIWPTDIIRIQKEINEQGSPK